MQICQVDRYHIVTRPSEYVQGVHEYVDWSDRPHFVYELGPAIEPTKVVKTGNLFRAQRVWAALDLLLTCDTISEARDRTRERMDVAGA